MGRTGLRRQLVGDKLYASDGSVAVDLTGAPAQVTGLTSLPDGLVGAPALAFQNEPTTGLFRVGAGKFASTLLGVPLERFTATGVGISTGGSDPAARLHVKEVVSAEIARFEGNGQGQIFFYDAASNRGRLGFGGAGGQIFSGLLANAVGIRSEAALQLGVQSSVVMTMREVGYGPGTGYIGLGGMTTPNAQLNLGGEASPELRLTSNTTGVDWGIVSNADTSLYIEDRTISEDRARFVSKFSLANAATQDLQNGTGLLLIVDTLGSAFALFVLRKSISTALVTEFPTNNWTVTKDTPNRYNVYWDGTASKLRLQNNQGVTRSFDYVWFGSSSG